jgi:hypothetical protein
MGGGRRRARAMRRARAPPGRWGRPGPLTGLPPAVTPTHPTHTHATNQNAPRTRVLEGEVQRRDAGVVQAVQDGALVADVVNHLVTGRACGLI